ncbi:hypothetical protein [Mucilaginibacter polytrichastri]|uniref:Outer membrane protein n=1 Tax=Mucilaginibacter polytrichastri TaxID=1302689 RepID=A0A1Q6A666_9SPHI|nr:hypothetical protein [Mucilaginibacter polytrichastri]OKS89505.1 hypothetical protein RG47T_4989 [Mucilaginibacter polytrichastri]SFS71305.1 Long-chain fatty acid transport protein [Mucilaginibacter polytrichastri]
MIKYIRFIVLFLVAVSASAVVMAQSTATTSSPYSRYGLGSLADGLLPQTAAMGGISTAINRINGYNNINSQNPASYSFINFTTIDVGVYSSFVTLKQTGSESQSNGNFRLSHIAFGIPVTKSSALSFGLQPYSEMGYNFVQTKSNYGTSLPSDTNAINNIYNGDGGLSKAYLGYGFTLGKHIHLGGNVSYIFGNLQQYRSVETPTLYGALNTRLEESNQVGGVNYDFGTQFSFDLKEGDHLTFGYSGSASTNLNTKNKFVASQYQKNFTTGDESTAADTIVNNVSSNGKIKLPLINHFGISFQRDSKFLIGADYSIGNWSQLSIAGVNQGLQNTQTFNVGGQITPNANQLHNYFAAIDYRLGFNYEKTYVNVSNTNINQKAVTFGFGFPLAPNQNGLSFYKINFSAEIGQRGTLANSLIQEKFYNFRLGFTLNDKWFRKYKFD